MGAFLTFLNTLQGYIVAWVNTMRLYLIIHSDEFLVNLISGIIDIAITVGVIDALLKKREKDKWKPAKGLLLSDLLNITDELIFELLPRQSRKINQVSYKFGNTTTTTTVTINKKDLSGIDDEILKNINYYINNNNLGAIDDVHTQLDYVLRFSSIIMQPVLFNHLLRLDRALTRYKHLRLGNADINVESEKATVSQKFIPYYLDVLTLSIDLRDYLIDQSDGHVKRKDKK